MAMENDVLKTLVMDEPSIAMLIKAKEDCVETCYDRKQDQKTQCGFGVKGICCKICHMGPCRISEKAPRGICGANADSIAARNYLRAVAAGTAAHSDHGRHLVLLLKAVAEGKETDFQIKDEGALRYTAGLYGIEEAGRTVNEVALDVANTMLHDFVSQEEKIYGLKLAPEKTQAQWAANGIEPEGLDRMIVEALHRTGMGTDSEYKHLLMHAFRTSISNGWAGSRICTMATDILFGTPKPIRSAANIGVLQKENVNIIVHGHEPQLSEMITVAAQDPELIAYAKEVGAQGITLGGICCTANEVLMRHGVPPVGNITQQELAIVTGAVEMMIVDVQCLFPSLPVTASKYHTEIVTTSYMCKIDGATHIEVDHAKPLQTAKDIVKRAIDNFKNRDAAKVNVPTGKEDLIAGFSVQTIKNMLGGTYRATFRPLNDAIIQGRIYGVVGIVGCTNPRKKTTDEYTYTMVKELVKRGVLVLHTGCAAISSAKAGYLKPEFGMEYASQGLREVCDTVGIPPVLHVGSCVDNTRILEAATEIVHEGGLGDILAGLPAVGVAPEWTHEKAISIGCYFVASGVDVVLGDPFAVSGSQNVSKFLYEECNDLFGGCFHVCEDPMEGVEKIMEILTAAREALNINKKAERKLYDMKDRRELDV